VELNCIIFLTTPLYLHLPDNFQRLLVDLLILPEERLDRCEYSTRGSCFLQKYSFRGGFLEIVSIWTPQGYLGDLRAGTLCISLPKLPTSISIVSVLPLQKPREHLLQKCNSSEYLCHFLQVKQKCARNQK